MKPQRAVIVETQTHLPTWMRVHCGLTWLDMPCADMDTKKLNFCLFYRGLYDPDLEPVSDEDSGLDEEGLKTAKRDSRGRVLRKAGRVKYGNINGMRLNPASAEKILAAARLKAEALAVRADRQRELLERWAKAKKQRGFYSAFDRADTAAHSAMARAMGSGRGCKGPLTVGSLDRIEQTFEKLKTEGWKL